ncbi:MAG: hypothetical protein QOD53_2376 [Thermoleophilaceae bacterium]|jgi:hypothetical protein|nr:hypothetical protein [Thermoleophilaceae bacterium]
MIATIGGTFTDVAGVLVLAVLLVPVGVLAVRRAAEGRDPAQAAVGIAAVMGLLVLVGLGLSLAGGLGAAGWLAAIAAAGLGVVLWTGDARERRRRMLTALLAVTALGLAVGALALSHAGAVDQRSDARFTQFWLVPRGAGRSAEVGVRNEEQGATTFRVLVLGPPPAGGTLLDRTVALGPGRSWTGRIVLPPTAGPARVDATLFRAGRAAPYRRVHLWTLPGG